MGFLKKTFGGLGRFLRVIGRSCYDMELYREVRTRPWPRALAYFVVFTVLMTALVLVSVAPSSMAAVKRGRDFIAANVPAGATLSVRSGQLGTNLPSPTRLGDDRMLVVIDTGLSGLSAQPDIGDHPAVVLGHDVMIIQSSATDRRVLALSELPDFDLTRESALAQADRYGVWMVAVALLMFGAAYFAVSLTGGAFFVLFAALVAALFGAMWRARLRFGQWVAVGFHAVTLPTLANALFNELGSSVPLVFTFLFFMIIVAVIADERAAPTGGPAAAVVGPPPPAAPPEAAVSADIPAGPARPRRRPAARKGPAKPRAKKRPPTGPAQDS